MKNSNYVCFEHRRITRGQRSDPRCPVDGGRMVWAGYRWRVPKRTDDKAWAEYRAYVTQLQNRLHYGYGDGYDLKTRIARRLLGRWS